MIVGAMQITGNTLTKDQVIRRQLRLRPGMIVTQGLCAAITSASITSASSKRSN